LNAVNTRGVEAAEVRHVNFLIRRGREHVAAIWPLSKVALMHNGVRAIQQLESVSGWNIELAEGAKVIADHRDLRVVRHVAALVHVNCRRELSRFAARMEVCRALPERSVGIRYFHGLPILHGLGETEVKMIDQAQIALAKRSEQRTALEADRLHGDGVLICLDREL
jgi:hypothetical protein